MHFLALNTRGGSLYIMQNCKHKTKPGFMCLIAARLFDCDLCVLLLSVGVALLCSFLLGLGDSCFNTQLLSIIGFMFRDNSAPAFAVFKFIQVRVSDRAHCDGNKKYVKTGNAFLRRVIQSFTLNFFHTVSQIYCIILLCFLSSPSWPPWPSSTVTTCCCTGSWSSWSWRVFWAPWPSLWPRGWPRPAGENRTTTASDVCLVRTKSSPQLEKSARRCRWTYPSLPLWYVYVLVRTKPGSCCRNQTLMSVSTFIKSKGMRRYCVHTR